MSVEGRDVSIRIEGVIDPKLAEAMAALAARAAEFPINPHRIDGGRRTGKAAVRRYAAEFQRMQADHARSCELLKAAAARDRAEAVERAKVPRGEPFREEFDLDLCSTLNVPRGEQRPTLITWLAIIAAVVTVWVLYVLSCGATPGCRP